MTLVLKDKTFFDVSGGASRCRAENLKNKFIETARARAWENVQKILAQYRAGIITKDICLWLLTDAINRGAYFSACAIACVKSLADDDIIAALDLEL